MILWDVDGSGTEPCRFSSQSNEYGPISSIESIEYVEPGKNLQLKIATFAFLLWPPASHMNETNSASW